MRGNDAVQISEEKNRVAYVAFALNNFFCMKQKASELLRRGRADLYFNRVSHFSMYSLSYIWQK